MGSKRQKLIIVGAGGHARVVSSILATSDAFEIAGFLDSVTTSRGEQIGDWLVLGDHSLLPDLLAQGVCHASVALGDNRARAQISQELTDMGFELVNAIHPTAILERQVELGRGNVIAAGAIICTNVRIGHNCIINTGATIDHETIIGDNVHVAPGVNVAGRVRIGRNSFIGIGAVIKDYVVIGENVTIGAGAVVVEDIPDNVVAAGVPAKPIHPEE